MSDLPEGWTTASLSDLAGSAIGGDWGKDSAHEIQNGVRVAVMRSTEYRDWDRNRARTAATRYVKRSSLETRRLEAGDLVVEVSGGGPTQPVGRVALIDGKALSSVSDPLICSNFCRKLRLRGLVDSGFVALALKRLYWTGGLETIQTHTTNLRNLDFNQFLALELPLPPLPEQKRIVAKVETLIAAVNAARERLEKVPVILKRFRQSLLAAACSGRLTEDWREAHPEAEPFRVTLERLRATSNTVKVRRGVPTAVEMPESIVAMELPETWMATSTAELLLAGALVDVKDGNHGGQHPKVSDFTPTGVPFITAAQVNNFRVDYEGAPKVSGAPLKRLRVGFAQPGDALLTHKGSVGRTALNLRPCVLTPQTTYYRCRAGLLDPEYLVYSLASSQFYGQLAWVMSQTTRDFVPISEQYKMFCLLPPFTEQRVIAERVKALLNRSDLIEKHLIAATSRAQKIGQAVVAKAFRGELVPTEAELARAEGRDYESAAQLLARIQAEREVQSVKVGKRKKRVSAPTEALKRSRKPAATG